MLFSSEFEDFVFIPTNIAPTILDFPIQISVQIVDDSTIEDDEIFLIILSSADQERVIVEDSVTTIVIVDNDGEWLILCKLSHQ